MRAGAQKLAETVADTYRQKMIDTAYEAGLLKGHISALEGKIKALETENARLRAQLEDAE